jgi:hypothetical protein
MAEVIVTALNLEHIQADSVDPGMPLFGQSSSGVMPSPSETRCASSACGSSSR